MTRSSAAAVPLRTSPERNTRSTRSVTGELTLLIVDDEPLDGRLLRAHLDRPGRIRSEVVTSGEEALNCLGRQSIDTVLTDLTMHGMDGIELVRRIRQSDPSLPVIILTANGSLERAVEGIRAGATDFLTKPVNVDALVALIERAVAERPLREEVSALHERRAVLSGGNVLWGDHPALDDVRHFALHVARAPDTRVLITGESGTGKSLLARSIHDLSGVTGRFVEVNCAALPPQLLESELFGHEKGAFTDAKALKRGLIELADRGTLLLDEIGSLPVELQAKLLLFLESRQIRRVGGIHPIMIETRVIAATNEDLRQRVRERAFRQDLLYRLDVAAVKMPPLREMPRVIPELARRFVRELADDLHRAPPELNESSVAALSAYPWPGNARELRNAIERALIFHTGGPLEIHPPAYPQGISPDAPGVSLETGLTLQEVEQRYLAAMLAIHSGDLGALATQLGISRKTLWEKRRRYGL